MFVQIKFKFSENERILYMYQQIWKLTIKYDYQLCGSPSQYFDVISIYIRSFSMPVRRYINKLYSH
jgi:hypothetical protein